MKKYIFIIGFLGILSFPFLTHASGEILNHASSTENISYMFSDNYYSINFPIVGYISDIEVRVIQTNGSKNLWVSIETSGGFILASSSIQNVNYNGGNNSIHFAIPTSTTYIGDMVGRITFHGGSNVVGLGGTAQGPGPGEIVHDPYLVISGLQLTDITSNAEWDNLETTSSLPLWNTTSSPFFVDCSSYNDVSFFSSGTIAMIGCSIQKTVYGAIGALLIPSNSSLQTFQNSFTDFKGTFPFKAFYQYTDAIQTAGSAVQNSSANYDLTLELPPIPKITLLTSSTLEQSFGSSTKNLIFTTEENIMWIGTGAAIVLMFLL